IEIAAPNLVRDTRQPEIRVRRKSSRQQLSRLNDRERCGDNFRRVTEAWEPVHGGFFAKPGELALREMPRGLLDLLHGVRFAEAAGRVFAQLRIPYELKWFRVRRNAAGDEIADLIEPAGCEHRSGARMNPRVERSARRQQTDFDDFVALQRIAAAAMDFAHRLSSEQTQFDRANYLLSVARRNARGRFGIKTREGAMQMLEAALFGPLPQTRANFFRALRRIRQPFEQRAQI